MHYWTGILKKLIIPLVLSCFALNASAQEMWGLTISNFSGSNGVLVNPSSIGTSKLYMDINLVTADIFLSNNYLYIHAEDYSLFKYISSDPQFPEYGPDKMPFDHYTSKIPKNAYASVFVKGPSAMLAVGRHTFALHTGVRNITSLTNIPYDVANFSYYGLDYKEQHNINYRDQNLRMGELAFGEVGATYAYSFKKFNMDDWTAGITVKRLFGIGGAYLFASDLDYMVVNDSTIDVKNMNGQFGFSIPLDYTNNDFPDPGPTIKGGGFGVDIGVTYQKKIMTYQKRRFSKLCRQRYIDYYYKIGLSLLDLGYVRFTDNAQDHSYDDVSRYWYNADTVSFTSMNQLMGSFSNVFYNDPQASYQGDRITVMLPAAISLQVDYKVMRNWYVAGVFIQSIPYAKSMVIRPTQVMVAPRYETPSFEASLPVSLYNWRYPRVGLALRYHFLSIGTDNLASLLGFSDFTGLDLYFSIKFNFRRGNCGWFNRMQPCENGEYAVKKKR